MIAILIVDQSRACLYTTAKFGEQLMPGLVLINPEARLHEHDLGSSSPGRMYNRTSGVHQTLTTHSNFRLQAVKQFVATISATLALAISRHEFDGIVLVAAPRLLSELRAKLPHNIRSKVIGSIAKDWVKLTPSVVTKQLKVAQRNGMLRLRGANLAA